MTGMLAGHGAELSRARTTYDGGAVELDAAGRGRDEIDVVDQKVEDEQRNRSIYIGRDPLVPEGGTFSPGWSYQPGLNVL